MKIFLAADHGGFELKEEIKAWLVAEGHNVEDCGNSVFDSEDDYPDFAFPLAERVAANEEHRGIMFCRSGGGMSIAANKVRGIRALDVFDLTSVIHARTHNDANIISVGADWLQKSEVKLIIENFLNTQFLAEERHQRRINKISIYELGE